MTPENLKAYVQEIVREALTLRNKHIEDKDAPVNYACIFSHNKKEYEDLVKTSKKIGTIIKETPTGPLFKIEPLDTVAGELKLLKIRLPDPTRPEDGDADFTIIHYDKFKRKYLSKTCFKVIKRENGEMIELMDSDFNVRAYFSNPPLDKQLGI
jgi:hypothetical protein